MVRAQGRRLPGRDQSLVVAAQPELALRQQAPSQVVLRLLGQQEAHQWPGLRPALRLAEQLDLIRPGRSHGAGAAHQPMRPSAALWATPSLDSPQATSSLWATSVQAPPRRCSLESLIRSGAALWATPSLGSPQAT